MRQQLNMKLWFQFVLFMVYVVGTFFFLLAKVFKLTDVPWWYIGFFLILIFSNPFLHFVVLQAAFNIKRKLLTGCKKRNP